MRYAYLSLVGLLVLGCEQRQSAVEIPPPDAGSQQRCGDGTLDPGEACDPQIAQGDGACPTGCDDGDPCTSDSLTGSAEACSARCEHRAVVACEGGDGCCPAGCSDDSDCASCRDECATLGAVRCEDNAVVTCGNFDGDACREWSSPAACASGMTCNAGQCEAYCTPDCTVAGAKKCDEAGAIVVCEDQSGCLKWGEPSRCPSPQVCDAGECALTCHDECPTEGDQRCVAGSTGQYERCGEYDMDGCLEWGGLQTCSGDLVCAGGQCASSCQSSCDAAGDKECQGNSTVTCGDYNADECLEWGTATPCAASETCTAGACQPRPPPGKVVINEVVYDSVGADTDTFVELFGPPGLSLAGFSLIGVNGNGGGRYQPVALVQNIGTGGLYLVAHPSSSCAAQADQLDSNVDYQNGPDSIQLRWGEEVVDAVGYGTFADTDVFSGEGRAAAGVAAGHSLGRSAQHTDTDDNQSDFFDWATPTPGAVNGASGPVCGNGLTEPGETCDGDCPESCDDLDACTADVLEGSAAGCDATCLNPPITLCLGGDGCCPAGCDATSDADCTAICGNGIIEDGELCDGNCPTAESCDDGSACTRDWLSVWPDLCNVTCNHTPITTCTAGDGCCAPGCNANTDSDCTPTCGNGVIESAETCDSSCPTSCDDGNACTLDTLTGSAATCTAVCGYQAIAACVSGDGCCPAGCAAQGDTDCPATCALGASVSVPGLSSASERGLSIVPVSTGFAVASAGGPDVRFDLLALDGAHQAGGKFADCGRVSCTASLVMTSDQFAVAYSHVGPAVWNVPGSENHVSVNRFGLDGTPIAVADPRIDWGNAPVTLLQRPAGGPDFLLGYLAGRPSWARVTSDGARDGVPFEEVSVFEWSAVGPAMTNVGTGFAMAAHGQYSSAGSTLADIEFWKADSSGNRLSGRYLGLPSRVPLLVPDGSLYLFKVGSSPVRYGLLFDATSGGMAGVHYAFLDSLGKVLEVARIGSPTLALRIASVLHEPENDRLAVMLSAPGLPLSDPARYSLEWTDSHGVSLGRTTNLGTLTGQLVRHPGDGVYRLFGVGSPMTITAFGCP